MMRRFCFWRSLDLEISERKVETKHIGYIVYGVRCRHKEYNHHNGPFVVLRNMFVYDKRVHAEPELALDKFFENVHSPVMEFVDVGSVELLT